jgi:hypothetical protein
MIVIDIEDVLDHWVPLQPFGPVLTLSSGRSRRLIFLLQYSAC